MPPVQIVEIIRPAEQGLSRPYLCRADDENFYFVKGLNTTRQSQAYEWICGHLALALGLPLAPFKLVEIVPELIAEAAPEFAEIGSGLAFGSQQVDHASWFELAQINSVPVELKADILVFDWWIRNLDRTHYNSNLLWRANLQSLTVIDHNCAFDPDFTSEGFLRNHIFGDLRDHIFGDLVTQAGYDARLSDALPSLGDACDTIPDEWFWHDQDRTVEANFEIEIVKNIITRCVERNFWSTA